MLYHKSTDTGVFELRAENDEDTEQIEEIKLSMKKGMDIIDASVGEEKKLIFSPKL